MLQNRSMFAGVNTHAPILDSGTPVPCSDWALDKILLEASVVVSNIDRTLVIDAAEYKIEVRTRTRKLTQNTSLKL